MKRKFIINPSARGNRRRRAIYEVAAHFRKELGEVDAILPRNRRDTIESTRKALLEGYEQIIAVGGDGTVNAVVNGFFDQGELVRPAASLVVSRSGSASDYFRTLYSDPRTDWRPSVTRFASKQVDVGKIEFSESPDPLYFVNLASVGLSATVVQGQRSMPRWVPGLASYVLPALGAVASARSIPLKVELDDQVFEGDVLSLFVAKGKTGGGGMKLGGGVSLDDGKFDVTIFKAMTRLEAAARFHRLFSGRFDDEKYFLKARSSRVKITSPEKVAMECDGELLGTTDLTLSIVPRALNVCVGN